MNNDAQAIVSQNCSPVAEIECPIDIPSHVSLTNCSQPHLGNRFVTNNNNCVYIVKSAAASIRNTFEDAISLISCSSKKESFTPNKARVLISIVALLMLLCVPLELYLLKGRHGTKSIIASPIPSSPQLPPPIPSAPQLPPPIPSAPQLPPPTPSESTDNHNHSAPKTPDIIDVLPDTNIAKHEMYKMWCSTTFRCRTSRWRRKMANTEILTSFWIDGAGHPQEKLEYECILEVYHLRSSTPLRYISEVDHYNGHCTKENMVIIQEKTYDMIKRKEWFHDTLLLDTCALRETDTF